MKNSLRALAVFLVAFLVHSADAATLVKGPYLIYPLSNVQMRVLWQTDATPKVSSIEWGKTAEYGNDSGELKESGAREHEHQFSFLIQDLVPGEKYFYRVKVDDQLATGSFTAAPPSSAQDVVLYAFGDTRTDTAAVNSVTGAMLADIAADPGHRQTIVPHVGDWVRNGKDESYWREEIFNRQYENTLQLLSEMPIMAARGNHEGTGKADMYYKYWPYRYVGNYFYSFDYGPVHVTVIDQYSPYKPDSPQYKWIETDLATSNKPFKIALFHEPAYGSGNHSNNKDTQEILCPLFKKYGVKLALVGHNHCYVHCEVDGITHLTVGGGGAPLYEPKSDAPYVVKQERTYQFARIEITGPVMKITAIRPDGSIIESFEIKSETAPVGTNEPVGATR